MSRFCFFTFNPHPSDTKEFVQELQSLLQPILQKTKQYIFVREKKGKPEEHIHLLFTSDTITEKDKIKQKIENKNIKTFIQSRIKNSNTDYKHAFDYLLIPHTQEDHMYYVGYICKEEQCNPITQGFSQEYITKCVKYYNTVERNKSNKIDNSWKHLKPNEIHCYIEHYSKELDISMDDPSLIIEMIKQKISFNQITERQMRRSKQELWIAHKDKVNHTAHTLACKDMLNDIHEDDWQYWKALAIDREERIDYLRGTIKQLEAKIKGGI